MALPSLKTINWVTTDCYGTLIDWERGILDACKKEAAKDGFSFEEQPFLDRFMEVQADTMLTNPATWLSAFRGGRAGTSLRPAKE